MFRRFGKFKYDDSNLTTEKRRRLSLDRKDNYVDINDYDSFCPYFLKMSKYKRVSTIVKKLYHVYFHSYRMRKNLIEWKIRDDDGKKYIFWVSIDSYPNRLRFQIDDDNTGQRLYLKMIHLSYDEHELLKKNFNFWYNHKYG